MTAEGYTAVSADQEIVKTGNQDRGRVHSCVSRSGNEIRSGAKGKSSQTCQIQSIIDLPGTFSWASKIKMQTYGQGMIN